MVQAIDTPTTTTDNPPKCTLYDTIPFGLTSPALTPSGSSLPNRRRYLIGFFYKHLDFRLPETHCLAEMFYSSYLAKQTSTPTTDACSQPTSTTSNNNNATTTTTTAPFIIWEQPLHGATATPYWYVHVPDTEYSEHILRQVSRRSMLIRFIVDPLIESVDGWDDLRHQISCNTTELQRPEYCGEEESFKMVLDSFGKTYTLPEKVGLIDSIVMCTSFTGRIDLKTPKHTWYVVECDPPRRPSLPLLPTLYYFGRQIDVLVPEAGEVRCRSLLKKYDLRTRRYLGPTSMDPELSYIMCAVGRVLPSCLFLDPFVGTGSVLVAAADIGAHTLGIDIDIRVLQKGKTDAQGEGVNIWTSFSDYALPMPLGILRADVHRLPLRPGLTSIVDCIVADPPYGVRAGARKSKANAEMTIVDRTTHVTSTAPYPLAECLRDLIQLAAQVLVVGGSLVYWCPAAPGYYKEEELPTHPVLEMVANCEQPLATRYSRRMIVMRKVREYDEEESRGYWEGVGEPTMALDDIRGYVYSANGSGGVNTMPRFRCKRI